jgi:hypothetical protein
MAPEPMKRFTPNIDRQGRLLRAAIAAVLFISAALAIQTSRLLAAALTVIALFVTFEALRGWCALRACGLETKY